MHRIAMRVIPLVTLLSMYALAQTDPDQDPQGEPDTQAVHDFKLAVRSQFKAEDFERLQETASRAATSKTRFPGGRWQLHTFYFSLQTPGSLTASESRWQAHLARLEKWSSAYPNSAIPRIALASAYERYAWKARGNGWANSVTPDAWKIFDERIQQARTFLEQAQSLADRDPQWFVNMQTVALAQGWTKEQMSALSEDAASAAPDYYYIYEKEIEYLLPKWHGKPGDAVNYLEGAADRIGGELGDYIYFQIAANFNCRRLPELAGLSWDRIKRGFAAAERLYTSTNEERNQVAYLALESADKDFAQTMFNRIGLDWDLAVWHGKPAFELAKASLTLPRTSRDSTIQ